MTKRKIFGLFVAMVLLSGGIFYTARNFFKADEVRAFTVSGQIYGQDTKKALTDVNISLSSPTYTEAIPITVKTNASGFYQISALDATFTNITISKDGYWDINGIISNHDDSNSFTLNLELKPGFGAEDAQIFVPKKDSPNKFGISLEPFNSSPASITKVTPSGETYTSSSVASSFNYFDQKTSDFATYDNTQAGIENQMAETIRIANACATNAGADKVTRVNDDINTDGGWFAPLPNMQTEYDQLLRGEIPICNTSALAEPQKTEASGNYPKLPDGYQYSFSDAQYRAETGPTDVGVFVAPKKSDSDAQLHCTINGCERLSSWGAISLSRGQTLSLMDDKWKWNSEGVVIRGRAKTEAVTFQTQTDKTFYLADPFMNDLMLATIQVKDGVETYSFTDAKTKGLIEASDPINLDSSISSGNIISFMAKKSVGLEVAATASTGVLGSDRQNVEIPSDLDPADVLKIAEHNTNLDAQEENRLANINKHINQLINDQIANEPQKQLDYIITLTKNGKNIVPEVANPQSPTVSRLSLPKAHAEGVKKFLQVDENSFYLGEDKTAIDTLGMAAAKKAAGFEDTIKGFFGEPIIVNLKYSTISIQKTHVSAKDELGELCNGVFDDSRNIISVDTECTGFSNYLPAIFLHEIGHSWRGSIDMSLFEGFEEGLAEIVPLIIYDQFDNTIIPVHESTLNYSDTLKRSFLIVGESETNLIIMPYGYNIWTRTIPAFTFYKVFLEDNNYLKEFHNILRLLAVEKKDPGDIDIGKVLSVKFVEGQDYSDWISDKFKAFATFGHDISKYENHWFILTPLTPKVDMRGCRLGVFETKDCVFNNTDLLMLTEKEINNYEETWTEVANKKVQLNFYSGTTKLTNVSSTQQTHLKGEILLGSLFENMKNSASGPFRYLAIKSEESLPDDERAVISQKIFYKNGSFTGHGMFGTADVPDGTNIIFDQINPDNSLTRIASVSSSGETYEFPSVENQYGRYKISIPTLNYSQQINKWKGVYNFNIKTDNDTPAITIQASSDSINYSLNEQASTFIEYGDSKGFYPNVSFGKSIGININEGDEVKSGSRSLKIENLTAGQTYHYRLWAIDRSGNISHTDDQTFTPTTPIVTDAIKVKEITKTSAKLEYQLPGLQPSQGFTAFVRYGTASGDYTTTTAPQTGRCCMSPYYFNNLTGLAAGNRYFFQLGLSSDSNPAHATWSPEKSFYTLPTADIWMNWLYSSGGQIVSYVLPYDASVHNDVSMTIVKNSQTIANITHMTSDPLPFDHSYSFYYGQGLTDTLDPGGAVGAYTNITIIGCRTATDCAVNIIHLPSGFNRWGNSGYIAEYTVKGTLDLLGGPAQTANLPAISSSTILSQLQMSQATPTSSQTTISSKEIVSVTQNEAQGTISYQTSQPTITELQIGTISNKFSTIYASPSKSTDQFLNLPNLKSRTYYYRIATIDDKGNKTYSQEYKLKHGNFFVRFFGDLWERARGLVKR